MGWIIFVKADFETNTEELFKPKFGLGKLLWFLGLQMHEITSQMLLLRCINSHFFKKVEHLWKNQRTVGHDQTKTWRCSKLIQTQTGPDIKKPPALATESSDRHYCDKTFTVGNSGSKCSCTSDFTPSVSPQKTHLSRRDDYNSTPDQSW